MKMVYCCESHFLVNNVKNLLEAQEINTFIKNEFAQGEIGEISAFDCWPEVWIYDEADYERAVEITASAQHNNKAIDWICYYVLRKTPPLLKFVGAANTKNYNPFISPS